MRPAHEKFDPETKQWVPDNEKALASYKESTVTNGVAHWKSNGQVPFEDMLTQWASMGLSVDVAKSNAARRVQNDKSIAEYREARKNYKPSPEEMFEMRAAFGPGTTVVDVFTGRKTRL